MTPQTHSLQPSNFPRETMRHRSGGCSDQSDNITGSHEPSASVRLVTVQSSQTYFHPANGSSNAVVDRPVDENEEIASGPVHLTLWSTSHGQTRSNTPDMCSSSRTREHSSQSRRSTLYTLPQKASPLLPSISSGSTYLSSEKPSLRMRTDSKSTLSRTGSHSTSSRASVDSGHKKLIPSIQTTEKFTSKWPRPQSLKALNINRSAKGWRNRKGVIQDTILELEEGYSLGLDKIDRWTRFKWCLMVSVITVLCYGSGAMICAILTWFRSAY